METGTWLPLTEYAIRKGISVSTLRRKIKSQSIKFRLDDGRYLLLDEAAAYESRPEMPVVRPVSQELHWKALEARISGMSRKMELMAEQISELKMLVQVFEERLEQKRD